MDHRVYVNDLSWSGNRKIQEWDKENFNDLVKQMTSREIEIMNAYLDFEGYYVKDWSESHEEYTKMSCILTLKTG